MKSNNLSSGRQISSANHNRLSSNGGGISNLYDSTTNGLENLSISNRNMPKT